MDNLRVNNLNKIIKNVLRHIQASLVHFTLHDDPVNGEIKLFLHDRITRKKYAISFTYEFIDDRPDFTELMLIRSVEKLQKDEL